MNYKDLAVAYSVSGWPGVLPLPANAKTPPPEGYTGRSGDWTPLERVQQWSLSERGEGNLGLRLPDWIVGIDVDAYEGKVGGRSFEQLADACGALPKTWISTSRDDNMSGILFYRIPEGTGWKKAHPPEHIDIIRAAHRYAVVYPSVHPEGRPYRWLKPGGAPAKEFEIPVASELPDLPQSWVDALFSDRGSAEFAHIPAHTPGHMESLPSPLPSTLPESSTLSESLP